MATATVALAVVAVINARQHAALTDAFESANSGQINVERANALIYAVVMESRGVYMSPDTESAKPYAEGVAKFNRQLTHVIYQWQRSVRADDMELFVRFSRRVS